MALQRLAGIRTSSGSGGIQHFFLFGSILTVTAPQCLDTHFWNPDGRPSCQLDNIQHYGLFQGLVGISLASQW
jgi:hypothetical protein